MSDTKSPIADLYRACGVIGNQTIVGAAAAHFSLLVDPSRGTVTGVVNITQAIAPPNGDIRVSVTGTIRELVFGGKVTRVVMLSGEYIHYCTPPALCLYQVKFTAHMLLEEGWNGTGGFEYGNNRVENVPVKSVAC